MSASEYYYQQQVYASRLNDINIEIRHKPETRFSARSKQLVDVSHINKWPLKTTTVIFLLVVGLIAIITLRTNNRVETTSIARRLQLARRCLIPSSASNIDELRRQLAIVEVDRIPGGDLFASYHASNSIQLWPLLKSKLVSSEDSRTNSTTRHQIAFKSLCAGWRIVEAKLLLEQQHKQQQQQYDQQLSEIPPPAANYWLLDSKLGALVAKFTYLRSSFPFRTIEVRVAHILSPKFPPLPAFIGNKTSSYYQSCRFNFSSYATLASLIEVTLVIIPSSNSNNNKSFAILNSNSTSPNSTIAPVTSTQPTTTTAATAIQQPTLQREHFVRLLQLRQRWTTRAETTHASSAWQTHSVVLPAELALLSLPFAIDVSSSPTVVDSKAVHRSEQQLFNGVAIANFTLSSQCFGLGVPASELLASAPPSDKNNIAANFERLAAVFGGPPPILGDPNNVSPQLPSASTNDGNDYEFPASALSGLDTDDDDGFQLKPKLIAVYFILALLSLVLMLLVTILVGHLLALRDSNRGASNQKTRGDCKALSGMINGDIEMMANPNYKSPFLLHYSMPSDMTELIEKQLTSYAMDRSKLRLTESLGRGAFGEVFRGYLEDDEPDDSSCSSLTSIEEYDENNYDDCYEEFGNYEENRKQEKTSNKAKNSKLKNKNKKKKEEKSKRKFKKGRKTSKVTRSVRQLAIKTLSDERMVSQDSAMDFVREAINMSLVEHRNIVKLIGVCLNELPLYIMMELLEGGSMKSFLLNKRTFTTSTQRVLNDTTGETRELICIGDLLVFALDIARGCDYMQQNNFIHRDLAARNCLLTSSFRLQTSSPVSRKTGFLDRVGDSSSLQQPRQVLSNYSNGRSEALAPRNLFAFDSYEKPLERTDNNNNIFDLDAVFLNGFAESGMVAKLADFGLSRDVYSTNYYRIRTREIPVRWVPPECLTIDGCATTQSDVWSFGVLLWEIFSLGQLPYQNLLDNQRVVDFIKSRVHRCEQQAASNLATPTMIASPQPLEQLLPTTSIQHYNEIIATNSLVSQSHSTEPLISLANSQLNATSTAAGISINSPVPSIATTTTRQTIQTPTPLPTGDALPPLPIPDIETPLALYDLMCDCWRLNPDERPRFYQIAQRLVALIRSPQVLAASLPNISERKTPL